MATAASPIVVAIWFLLNTTILLCVGFFVYKKKSKSSAFCIDFWLQRRIYASLIIVFLDQATDIGVLINWYVLLQEESKDDVNFESIDMRTFFYPLLAFFILYQIIAMFSACDSTVLWDIPLQLFQIYPFKVSYLSISQSYDVMESNATIRGKKQLEQMQQVTSVPPDSPVVDAVVADPEIEDEETETVKESEDNDDDENDQDIGDRAFGSDELKPLRPNKAMNRMLLAQCTLETMPALVLQTVFWVRSFNDSTLRSDGNGLVVLSIIASLLSVTSRYVAIVDEEWVIKKARSGIFSPWFLVRVVYRLLSVISTFTVFVMMWVCVGGVWLAIFSVIEFIGWMIAAVLNGDEFCTAFSLGSGIRNMIGVTLEYKWPFHAIKFTESMAGMILIFVFLYSSFECGVCVDKGQREAYRNDNDRIALLFVIGWFTTAAQFAFFILMKVFHVIDTKK